MKDCLQRCGQGCRNQPGLEKHPGISSSWVGPKRVAEWTAGAELEHAEGLPGCRSTGEWGGLVFDISLLQLWALLVPPSGWAQLEARAQGRSWCRHSPVVHRGQLPRAHRGQRRAKSGPGGRWGQIGLARRINSTDGDNYMPSRMRPKRCHIWFAFYPILTSSSK